ncbi:MAG TPA: GPW/gp25 family protein [Longimicrobium sp.]|nr:GPW/gp25 family protein [Longimicrobium sp.]
MNLDFPYRIDGRGRTAAADEEAHVRDLIEQILFTAPGERVNRPAFGSGVMQMVFAPNADALAAAAQFQLQGALQQWLGDRIQVEGVVVEAKEATLTIVVRYVLRRTQQRGVARFERPGGP